MRLPPYLKVGDRVCILSTARKVTRQELELAIDLLQNEWGLEVALSEHLFAESHQFAGTDEQRIADLQTALDDPEIKAIFCARGGYGTVRLIDKIDFTTFITCPKWIVGFSDVTVLHQHVQRLQIASVHATMPFIFLKEGYEYGTKSLHSTLFGKPQHVLVSSNPLNRVGSCEGELIGGNLTIINQLIGTSSIADTRGKILFLEDLDEYLYHIDRMMMHLDRAGILSGLAGLVVGGMTDMKDNAIPFGEDAYQIIARVVSKYTFPVVFDFPAGHIPNNTAMVFGAMVGLHVDSDKASLSYLP